MNWVGLDVHQVYCVAVVLDDEGHLLQRRRIESTRTELEAYFRGLGPDTSVVLEATGCWGWMYDTIRPLVRRAALAHPQRVRLIAESRIKTDRRDAEALADLLRLGAIPEAYAAPPQVRDRRQVVRTRITLARVAASMKNRVRAVLRAHGLQAPRGKALWGKKGRAWLRTLTLAAGARRSVDSGLGVLDSVAEEIQTLEREVGAQAHADPLGALLQTIPGIGPLCAQVLSTEAGDMSRFHSGGQIASWAGLVPSVSSSGGRTRYGRLTKQGNRWVRWVLIEGVTSAVRSSRRFRNLYERVRRRHGRPTARVAVAREMLIVAWAMARTGEVFDPERAVRPRRGAGPSASSSAASPGPASASGPAPSGSPCACAGCPARASA